MALLLCCFTVFEFVLLDRDMSAVHVFKNGSGLFEVVVTHIFVKKRSAAFTILNLEWEWSKEKLEHIRYKFFILRLIGVTPINKNCIVPGMQLCSSLSVFCTHWISLISDDKTVVDVSVDSTLPKPL